jgi:hypothetical protein
MRDNNGDSGQPRDRVTVQYANITMYSVCNSAAACDGNNISLDTSSHFELYRIHPFRAQ